MEHNFHGKKHRLSGLAYGFFVLLLFTGISLKAQDMPDTAIAKLREAHAISIYHGSLQQQSGLYNGSEYVQYMHLLKEGHPYLDTAALTNGNVCYDGTVYKNVPMLYDIIKDELIIQHFNKVFLVQLVHPKIDSFSLQAHHFLPLGRDSIMGRNIQEGFYDRLYNGKVELYVRRRKFIRESIREMEVERNVYQKDSYFLCKDGIYHDIYTESSILKLLKDKRAELRQALRKQRIRFRKDRERAMKLIAEQYDAL